MRHEPEPLDLISSPEAARIIGRSSRTIHRLVDSGELIPVSRVSAGPNGAYVFHRADVERIAGQFKPRAARRVSA